MSESIPGAAAPSESRAFFAALLAACRSNCDCKVCEILRGVADSMAAEFKPKVKTHGGKARTH